MNQLRLPTVASLADEHPTSILKFSDTRNYISQKRTIAGTTAYSYDQNGQLIGASGISGSESFTYDAIGNRVSDAGTTYDYDPTGQRITQDSNFSYQYDNNGNIINKISRDGSRESLHLNYSSKNELVRTQVFTGLPQNLVLKNEIIYHYDVLGRKMQKQVQGASGSYTRKYTYFGDNVLAEFDGGNSLLAKYTYSPNSPDDLLAVEFTSSAVPAGLSTVTGKYFYLKDHVNTVTDITDASGNIIQKYQYSSFGQIQKITDASGSQLFTMATAPIRTSFSFTAREYETESDLYYYRARYYDANTGRFLQKDPDPGVLDEPLSHVNKYAYASNNSIMNSDPSGRFVWAVFWIAMAAGSIFAAGNFSAAIAAGEWNFWKLFFVTANGFAYGVAATYATATTGFFGTVAISFLLGTTHSAINQGIMTGSVDWDIAGNSGVAAGAGAAIGFGAGKLFQGFRMTGWEVNGRAIGDAKQFYNGGAGVFGAISGFLYDATRNDADSNGIPKCSQVNTLCTNGP